MLLTFRNATSSSNNHNCFAYLTSEFDYSRKRAESVNSAVGASPFGYFVCYSSNEKVPSTSAEIEGKLDEIVLQCFALKKPFEVLILDEGFSKKCGLTDGQKVILQPISQILNAEQIEIMPETEDDWKIIENSAFVIEEIFLQQIRILRPKMRFVLYLGTGLPVSFYAKDAIPSLPPTKSSSALLISTETLVLVAPFQNTSAFETSIVNSSFTIQTFFQTETSTDIGHIGRFLVPDESRRVFRILPAFEMDNVVFHTTANVIVTVNTECMYTKTYIVEVESFLHRFQQIGSSKIQERKCAVWVDLSVECLDECETKLLNKSSIELINLLKKYDQFTTTTKYCWISPALRCDNTVEYAECTAIEVFRVDRSQLVEAKKMRAIFATKGLPIKKSRVNAEELKRQITSILFNNECAFPNVHFPILFDSQKVYTENAQNPSFEIIHEDLGGEEVTFDVCLSPNIGDNKAESNKNQQKSSFYMYCLPFSTVEWTFEFSEHFGGKYSERKTEKNALSNFALSHWPAEKEFQFQSELLDQIEEVVVSKLLKRSGNSTTVIDHILLCGNDFTGKTTIFHFLARRIFSKNPILIFPHRIDCSEWKGRSPDTVCRRLKSTLCALSARRPALLFLDNFDFLVYSADDEEQMRSGKVTYSKIIEEIQQHFCHSQLGHRLLLICGMKSDKKMPEELRYWEGYRLFSHSFNIPKIEKSEQLDILAHLLGLKIYSNTANSVEFDMNFCVGELCKLSERIRIQKSCTNFSEESIINAKNDSLSSAEVREALENRPRIGCFAQNNNLNSASKPLDFTAVGGLHSVKQRLVEIFVWPIKYPKMFASCGIAVGTRAILHGPSGCGKTMLLRALARECGSNFNVIHVRGPELLSKYIGQSEENVRAVFERARASRPCVLALDEFDALAPSRGHDNTGVTDRVVNQFLTELDGVESGVGEEGVYVIAATNRLGLIDRALLRPGRFDHKILVAPPTQIDERIEILRIHTADVYLDKYINLEELATMCDTPPWSGAEMRAWVINAKFYALNEQLSANKSGQCATMPVESSATVRNILLTKAHFVHVFAESAPKTEFAYNSKDYANGTSVNPTKNYLPFDKLHISNNPQKRVTLA